MRSETTGKVASPRVVVCPQRRGQDGRANARSFPSAPLAIQMNNNDTDGAACAAFQLIQYHLQAQQQYAEPPPMRKEDGRQTPATRLIDQPINLAA